MRVLIVLSFLLLLPLASWAQPPFLRVVGVSSCENGSITVVANTEVDYEFLLEKKLEGGLTEEDYEEIAGPQSSNYFGDLEVGDYRVTAFDDRGCSWGGIQFYYNSPYEEYQECLAFIGNSTGLYVKDCDDDDGSSPSWNNCETNIWNSPSIRNCFLDPGIDENGDPLSPTETQEQDWDCDASPYSSRSATHQLWMGEDDNGQPSVEQYQNQLLVTIYNTTCEDYVADEDDHIRMAPYWTFARTGEYVPEHWVKDYVENENGFFLLGNCLQQHGSNLVPNPVDWAAYIEGSNCIRNRIPSLLAGEDTVMKFPWHPPSPFEMLDVGIEFQTLPSGDPQLCLLVQIEDEHGKRIKDMEVSEGGPVNEFVRQSNDLSTVNLVYMNKNWDGILEQYAKEPRTFPKPLNRINPYQEEEVSGIGSAVTPVSQVASYQQPTGVKIVMVNNDLAHPAMLAIDFIKETNNNSITEFGDLFIYPDKTLWNKIEESGFKGAGYEVHDAENQILKLTEGNGFIIDEVDYEPSEKRYLGFKFEEHLGKKPTNLDQPFSIDYLLTHRATYMRRGVWETTKSGGSGVKFRAIIHGEDDENSMENQETFLSISPNPSDGNFELSFYIKDDQTTCTIEVLDSQGGLVHVLEKSQKLNKGKYQTPHDLGKLVAGVYLVKLTLGTETFTEKLVIY